MNHFKYGILVLGFGLSISCVYGEALRRDASQIKKKIVLAVERGAGNNKCAPLELAQAEANLDFLEYELLQGDYQRALWHHRAAIQNVNEAIRKTDPAKCIEREVLIADQSSVNIQFLDRDQDGILGPQDQCPDEPEDRDSFEDDNGCPDPDNDADTVLDVDDQCPLEPGQPENHGCPLSDRDEDGIPDVDDQCPLVPEDKDQYQDLDGCPEENDRDNDGIVDALDKCPVEPEDRDAYLDEDGCPDLDNDDDGVLDLQDSCPLQPGAREAGGCPIADRDGDGFLDEVDQCPDLPGKAPIGCPDRVLVEVKGQKIEIKEKINFVLNQAKIDGSTSFAILDQVAQVLTSKANIKVVIEGHTDSTGAADYNLQLSDGRATAVRAALIERGIAPSRMEAIGYGESRPLESNQSRDGRAKNRRVEFRIVKKE